MIPADPHAGQPVREYGAPVQGARLAMIVLHGRGGSADDILSIARGLGIPDVAYRAPQAAGRTWYPYSFLAPIDSNEPFLTSALGVVDTLVEDFAREGVPHERVAFLGFSQGGCLALEFAARRARRYAAVIGLSAGIIGPLGTPRAYTGSLAGTPVFIGCSDIDAHIPLERVHESASVLGALGAGVDERIYPGMGHTINQDEIDAIRRLIGEPDGGRGTR